MTDLPSFWPREGESGTDAGGSGAAFGNPPLAASTAKGSLRPRLVAASLALLYLAVVAVGWTTNAADGYYGISRIDSRPGGSGQLTIAEIAAGSPADRAGLRPGDVILAVDGARPGEARARGSRGRGIGPDAAPTFRLRPLAVPPGDVPLFRRTTGVRQPGERSTIQVRRPDTNAPEPGDGGAQDVTLILDSRLAAPGMVLALLTWHIVGLLTLGVSAVVILNRPGDVAARLLLATGSCFALALALLSWDNRPFPDSVANALIQATVFLSVLGSASLLHLCLAFPTPHRLLARLGAFGPAALSPIGGATAALYVLPFGLALSLFLGPVDFWPWSYLVVIPLVGLALLALARSILHPPSPMARAQLKWIAAPLLVGLAGLALGPGVSAATGARADLLSPTATVAAWVLFPLGLGIAILRYRLFDVDLVFRAAMIYPLLAALLSGGYLAAVLVLGRIAVAFLGESAAENLAVSAVAALLVAAAAQLVHRRLQTALDRLLYRDRLARQRLLEEAIAALVQAAPDEVITFLTGHVVNRLDLARAWLVLPSGVTANDGSATATLQRSSGLLLARMRDAVRPTFLLKREELTGGGASILSADEPELAVWHAAGVRLLLPLRTLPTKRPADNAARDDTGSVGGRGLSYAGARAVRPRRTAVEDEGHGMGSRSSGADEGTLGLWLIGARRSGSLPDSEDVRALAQIARQAALMLDYDRLHWREAAEMRRSARFRRYFSPQIADLIASEGGDLAIHRRELTVLFAELHGFSALGETSEPEELVGHLNDCLETMTEVIFGHGGTLDKYLGDGIMAFFGDPLPQPDHATRALRAAVAMQRRLKELRGGSMAGIGAPEVGIGLSTGWVTVGTIGSAARQEYTVVGHAVTIAARLAATAGPGEVLLAEKTRRLLGEDAAVAPRGVVSVEGLRKPVLVFGHRDGPVSSADAQEASPTRLGREASDGAEAGEETLEGAEMLARTPLFASLPTEELRKLAGRLRLRRFKKGAIVVGAHEPSSSFFLIRSGTVKVTRALVSGDEAVISILGRGEFFGEMALIEGQSGGFTVVALQPTEILVLSHDVFLGCLREYPSTAGAAIGLLSERIRRLSDQLGEAYALELPQRLARRLLALGRTHGKETGDGLVIDLPLTQSELAGMVGASRQRVNRLLAEWQDRRLLRLGSYGRMTLLRPENFVELSRESMDN